jgi:hypothetical protein
MSSRGTWRRGRICSSARPYPGFLSRTFIRVTAITKTELFNFRMYFKVDLVFPETWPR